MTTTAQQVSEQVFYPEGNEYQLESLRKRIRRDGETEYSIPCPVQDAAARMALGGISRAECIRFPFCGEPMLLYLVWDRNKEVADLMWASVTREHKAQNRETRCSIPGKRKAFIRCDDHNRCEKCPWGRRPEERERSTISLETIPEDWIGWTGTASPVEEEALLRADLERALAHLKQVNRAAWLAWKMKHIEGMDTKEIGAALQYSLMSVYKLLRIANRILADDLKEEEYA